MKKTVSINIGGIIFHIEEDGYDKLRSYLDAISAYFSSFEEKDEIVSDIESRIAEIFLQKLTEGKQTVSITDVEDVIATMGTTKDFEATVETDPVDFHPESQAESENTDGSSENESGPKKMYRDTKRRILGGVASGIAHYFSIDPLWIRLVILLLFINVFVEGVSGAILLAYIVLWIVLPGNDSLEEDKKIKKLFRNEEDRVLGGICSGIAAYFGVDVAVIRFLFVISIFLGGAGIVAYIILWIITPAAKTITEKMQMQGEPVTLSNIEQNVKKGLNVKDEEETPLVKILLFPFRFIAIILNGLGTFLGPFLSFLGQALRIIFGAILVIIGTSTMLTFLTTPLALLGLGTWDGFIHSGHVPLDLIQQTLNPWMIIAISIVAFIPALGLALLGLVIIMKRAVINNYVGWSLFGIWLIAFIVSAISIPAFIQGYSSENNVRTEHRFPTTEATPTLSLREVEASAFQNVELRLRGHADSTYKLLLNIESRGANREDAEQNAAAVSYQVTQSGDNFLFDSDISYPDDVPFKFQEVNAIFYIPYGKVFRVGKDLDDILVKTFRRSYRGYELAEHDWVFDENGLKCITCKEKTYQSNDDDELSEYTPGDGDDQMSYPFEDFSTVEVASYLDVNIERGDEWKVVLRGDDRELDEVYLNQVGDVLKVKYREDDWDWWRSHDRETVKLLITMPELEKLTISGQCKGDVKGFRNDYLDVEVSGQSKLYVNVEVKDLNLDLSGASKVKLIGQAQKLNGKISGSSKLEAFRFTTEDLSVDISGASKAEVYASRRLKARATGASKVQYRGDAEIDARSSGASKIERD